MVTRNVYVNIYSYISKLEDGIPFLNRKLNQIYYTLTNKFSCFNPNKEWNKISKQIKTNEDIVELDDIEKLGDNSTIGLGDNETQEEGLTNIDDDGIEYNSIHIRLKSSYSSEIVCAILQNHLKIVTELVPENTSPTKLWKALETYHNSEQGRLVTEIQ